MTKEEHKRPPPPTKPPPKEHNMNSIKEFENHVKSAIKELSLAAVNLQALNPDAFNNTLDEIKKMIGDLHIATVYIYTERNK